jgi:hypothetical protein
MSPWKLKLMQGRGPGKARPFVALRVLSSGRHGRSEKATTTPQAIQAKGQGSPLQASGVADSWTRSTLIPAATTSAADDYASRGD